MSATEVENERESESERERRERRDPGWDGGLRKCELKAKSRQCGCVR